MGSSQKTFDLSAEQSRVVRSCVPITVVTAVPGSGKTAVIVARAQYLRDSTRENVLVLTFSKKASLEIKRRLGNKDNAISVGTIHGFCFGILKTHWRLLGTLVGSDAWPESPKVISPREEKSMLSRIFQKENSNTLFSRIQLLRSYGLEPLIISTLLNKGIYFPKVSQRDIDLWTEYEQYKTSRGFISFEDMGRLTELLLPIPQVAATLCSKYRHILLDEAQDTSVDQWKVLRTLFTTAKSVLAVGDRNQCIYAWRGADGSVLTKLESLPNSATFTLQDSYRSCNLLVKLANKISPDGTLINENKKLEGIKTVTSFDTIQKEVESVISLCTSTCAILSRTNAYLEPFERELIKQRINYNGSAFYRSDHVKELAAFLSEVGLGGVKAATMSFLKNEDYSRLEKQDLRTALELAVAGGVEHFVAMVQGTSTSDNAVTLTTGHSSKSQEWDTVFVVGADATNMPHYLSLNEKEERCLFYVMTTRARSSLHISYVGRPSPFIPKEDLVC